MRGFAYLGALTLSLFVSSASMAAFTPINAPYPGEDDQATILSTVYGGSFVANGVDFSNGAITATRVDDDNDKLFTFDVATARPLARFGRLQIEAGFREGSEESLALVTGKRYDVSGNLGKVNQTGPVEAIIKTSEGNVFSSDSNPDGADHLVTYLLSGEGVKADTYVLFWEDRAQGDKRADFDFNDLVIEAKINGAVVPLPAAAIPGLAMLVGLGGYKALRRRFAA